MSEFQLGRMYKNRESGARAVVVGFEQDNVIFAIVNLDEVSVSRSDALKTYEPMAFVDQDAARFESYLQGCLHIAMFDYEIDRGHESRKKMNRCDELLEYFREQRRMASSR